MHLASEVSSTTNQPSMDGMTNNNKNITNNNNNSGILTAETLAERTLDGLLAEHPGELIRTGSPHIVIISNNFEYKKDSIIHNVYILGMYSSSEPLAIKQNIASRFQSCGSR